MCYVVGNWTSAQLDYKSILFKVRLRGFGVDPSEGVLLEHANRCLRVKSSVLGQKRKRVSTARVSAQYTELHILCRFSSVLYVYH